VHALGNRQSVTHLLQDAESHTWHPLHILREYLLKQRRNVTHDSLRVHALDARQDFRKYVPTVVLYERGRYGLLSHARA
jgi:hypothetical protein